MLQLDGIGHSFGGLHVLKDVTTNVSDGELLGLIGPNGAGKTTLFNIITGFIAPSRGRVTFKGRDITGAKPHVLAARGMVRTFQGARVFPALSVRDNLRVARHLRQRASAPTAGDAALALFDLDRYLDEDASSLPSGMMRVLGIAMAVTTGADMLLLDEPAAGLSGEETAHLQQVIARVHGAGTTVVVIDHNLHFLMGLVHRAVVLDSGTLIADGTPEAVTADPRVIEAYLGSDAGEDTEGAPHADG